MKKPIQGQRELEASGYKLIAVHLLDSDISYPDMTEQLFDWYRKRDHKHRFVYSRYGEGFVRALVYELPLNGRPYKS